MQYVHEYGKPVDLLPKNGALNAHAYAFFVLPAQKSLLDEWFCCTNT